MLTIKEPTESSFHPRVASFLKLAYKGPHGTYICQLQFFQDFSSKSSGFSQYMTKRIVLNQLRKLSLQKKKKVGGYPDGQKLQCALYTD